MNRMKHVLQLTFAVAVLMGLSIVAQANLLTNGSFEEGTDPGMLIRLNSGSTDITGWIVTGTQIDYIGTYWQASNGSRSLDLDGDHVSGGVAQAFATVPGQLYFVTFDMAGNPDGQPTIKSMRVHVDNAAAEYADFIFDITGHNKSSMGWESHNWSFTADADTTTIEFLSTNSGPDYGPALDNVSVIPEPMTFSLLAMGACLSMLRRKEFLNRGR